MLSSIHPLGERARGNRWIVTVAQFAAAAVVAGALVGAALGALGSGLGIGTEGRTAAVVAVAGLALWLDATGRHRAVARPRRQVDDAWLSTYRRWIYAGGWGLQLGAGVVTVMPAAVVWLVFALAGLSGSAVVGALLGAAFGLTRGLSLLTPAAVATPEALRRFHAAMAARAGTAHRLAIATDAVVALAAITALAR